MTQEQFLSIPELDHRIHSLEEAISAMRRMTASLSSFHTGPHVQSSASEDRTGKLVASIVDAENEMQETVRQLAELRLEAMGLINTLPEPEQSVMRLRIICGKTIEQIAAEMYFSRRNCYYLQQKAIKHLFGYNQGIG